ncbi:hypothetical protein DFQ09_1201 [Winogradskyella pacifica]|uniref:Uncharacterized protein n=1 Tax=Winogradskyella pacifica TaxID=664642 RepID=A0A3D9LJN8_9FLAO|nr:hypothetical protein [Winogradskyella pacifica]REE07611.1 hypothetical protein DFQ09_1201 [Winogradskyella pacifica]
MTKKETVIKSITEMDIELLDVVLDNNKAYMEVSKGAFIKTLRDKFDNLKKQGVTKFEKVSKGTCNKCYKGCNGYTFLTKNNDYLDLLFKEENNEIVDLFRCSDFKNEENLIKKNCVYFRFKKDESKNYNPSSHIASLQKQVEVAVKEFEKYENKITDIEEFVSWFKDNKKLYNSVKNFDWDYNFVWPFLSIYVTIENFNELAKNQNSGKKALVEFDNSSEKSMIDWLLKYEKSNLRFSSGYEKTENWKKTNLILFKNGETFFETGGEIKLFNNVLVDIKKCKESIEFSDLFSKHYWEYEKKYAPTKELFEVYGDFEIELSEYLSARNLYPEILKKYNIKPKEKQEKTTANTV